MISLTQLSLNDRSKLYDICEQWTDFSSAGPAKKTEKRLSKIMLKNGGIGLAANQVGLDKRVFAIKRTNGKIIAMFNPEIVEFDDQPLVSMKEGCLSFPGEILDISRPSTIVVTYQTSSGAKKTETLTGIESRCFQHELDHLNGITFHSHNTVVL